MSFLKPILLQICLFLFFKFSIDEANDNNQLEYLSHSCSTNKTFPPNTTYESNLHTLVTSFSSVAATAEFYSTTSSGGDATGVTIYGMFMCRGDIKSQKCQKCIEMATQKIALSCPNSKEAIIWYHECMVRYSNRSFFSTVDEWPRPKYISHHETSNITTEGSYGWLLATTLNDAIAEAAKSANANKKFATKHVSLGGSQNVYTLVQCTPDLSSQDCSKCLNDVMKDIPICCLGTDGGMVLYPSCNLMFGLHRFYSDANLPINWYQLPKPFVGKPLSGKPSGRRLKIIIASTVPIVAFLMLYFFGYHFRRINALRRYKAILKENFGNESTTLESLQFDLVTIEEATNNFSCANLIGKGGFGEVYKGILSDGREIAVKRLSITSEQGIAEFKNEVLLIAKLQHRNLVALLGFCLQEGEKILIYEFVPNKSLDYFLFGSELHRLLSWCERFKIIGGIASAILYLHEYSRLKIIHRDIKPSNILLDANMNPKISDFGMARMVAIDQDQGRTRRIVGTYGYMSPEYAMLGKYSEKSDIFSFGVMILEIVSGKKNSSYDSYYNDGLLSHAWKQWRDGTPFEILDPNLHESCSQMEVIRCIQVGLLCVQENPNDRPQMAEVVSYLSNLSIELPFPHEPAFFVHGRMNPNMVALEVDSGHLSNCSTQHSLNEMSISISVPR
ncbi:cysteine-rich receptor-like protein kinase 19 isoform X2 [Arachis duranensis]|uniref:Cysteine-rich receptor-like protein kinase 19 isoform X2 n=1 Tax=Arachis duranensis TaxID=130453 RepID=A0A9C6TFT9_ARADU|nr:cysteine-rich receptor-like protein kinase 19 isoform X2 [Arachis duranensis]